MLASFKDGDHPNNSRTRGFSNGDKNPEPSAAFARTLDWLDGEDNIQWVSLHGNSWPEEGTNRVELYEWWSNQASKLTKKSSLVIRTRHKQRRIR